jgi:UDP-N-acetylmuramoyl-tripeptide--D-alanyl-D-alanine ligase
MRLALGEIAGMIGAALRGGQKLHGEIVQGYSIDSRTIRPGELFFAIRGARDGHEFIGAALEKGAVAAVASRGSGDHLLLVPDVQAALQQLGSKARQRWGGRVVAITGSNGKTTTKEVTAALLATRFRVAKSEGNLNNDLGVPLSLLRMDDVAEIAVLEMGMNHAGEIRALAAIAQPDVGLVTNVNAVHLEFFRSVDEIAAAKRELIASLPANGSAVLNADDPRVREFGRAFRGRVVTFGIDSPADVRAVAIDARSAKGTCFRLDGSAAEFLTPLPGRHNLYNSLAGLAAARALGIEPSSLAEAVRALQPARMRGEIQEIGGIRIINDCYNSNPCAAEAMLDLLAATPGARRIAVLGEMLELGLSSEELHRQVGRKCATLGLDLLAGVRGNARFIVDEAARAGMDGRFFADSRTAGEFLRDTLLPGDVVLFKASRGVKLEEALEIALHAAREPRPVT